MSQKGLTREKENENSGIRLKEEKQLEEGSPLSTRVNKQILNKKNNSNDEKRKTRETQKEKKKTKRTKSQNLEKKKTKKLESVANI